MLKLVIVIPKINQRFIMEPLVLVQARTNATQSSGKICLLGPIVVVRGMIKPPVVLNGVYLLNIGANK